MLAAYDVYQHKIRYNFIDPTQRSLFRTAINLCFGKNVYVGGTEDNDDDDDE